MENLVDNLKSVFSGKRVVVTGHNGFKGSWLVALLNLLGAEVHGISLQIEEKSPFREFHYKGPHKSYVQDLRDFEELNKLLNRINPELVFHLAAQALVLDSYEKPLETFQVNILGTANLLESLKSINTTGVVVATTDKVYKNEDSGKIFKENDELWGHDPYSLSKVGTELTVAAWRNLPSLKSCKFVTVRAGNVFGPGDRASNRLFPDLMSGIREKKEVVIRNPKSIRPWQYVLDPIIGYVLVGKQILLNHDVSDSYNFGPIDDSFITVEELIALVSELAPLKTLHQSHFNRAESKVLKLNSELAVSELGWTSSAQLIQGVVYTLDLDSAKMEVSDIYKHLEVYLSTKQDSFVE